MESFLLHTPHFFPLLEIASSSQLPNTTWLGTSLSYKQGNILNDFVHGFTNCRSWTVRQKERSSNQTMPSWLHIMVNGGDLAKITRCLRYIHLSTTLHSGTYISLSCFAMKHHLLSLSSRWKWENVLLRALYIILLLLKYVTEHRSYALSFVWGLVEREIFWKELSLVRVFCSTWLESEICNYI